MLVKILKIFVKLNVHTYSLYVIITLNHYYMILSDLNLITSTLGKIMKIIKLVKQALCVFLLVFLSLNCFADSVYLGMWSHHFSFNTKCNPKANKCYMGTEPNSSNDLIMYEKNGYEVGTFVNSYFVRTYLVAKRFEVDGGKFGDFQLYLHAGISHGYHACWSDANYTDDKKTCPMAALELSYNKYKIQPAAILFNGGVGASIKYNF